MPDKYSVMVRYVDNLENSAKKIEMFQKLPPIFMPKTYIKDPFYSRNPSFTPDLLKIITDFRRGVP